MTGLLLEEVAVRRSGRLVLAEVAVAFPPGSLTALVGPNGAGKSTLLAAAAGLVHPARGRVTLGGRPLAAFGRRELAQARAYLPQAPRADWPLSVERVVALGLTPSLPAFGGLPPALEAKVEAALLAQDLIALRERPVSALSGGELARAMLARAVVGDPQVLLVDEPTAGLDPRHAIDSARRLRARAEAGSTVAMAIHDLDLALRFAHRAVAVKEGRVIAAGPVREVFTEPLMEQLYDVPARLAEDEAGVSIRFTG